jgi:putative inorganic carbon (hco3(-)) transporter
MGLPGLAIMLTIAIALLRKHRLTTERIALYAGLAALCIVALGDFSWHIPATQVVLAFYVGVLLR